MEKLRSKYRRFFILGLIIGILISIINFTFIYSFRLERNFKKIKKLELDLKYKENSLKELQNSLKVNKYTVEDIEVKIDFKEQVDDVTKYILEDNIKSKFVSLIGREVETIDIEMLSKIMDNRMMYIKKDKYMFSVSKILAGKKLKIYLICNKISI